MNLIQSISSFPADVPAELVVEAHRSKEPQRGGAHRTKEATAPRVDNRGKE